MSIAKGASYPLCAPSCEFESLMLILASKFSGKEHGSVSWKELKSSSNMPSLKEPLASKVDVVEQMMSILSKELTKQQQRAAVKELLIEQENILSKGE